MIWKEELKFQRGENYAYLRLADYDTPTPTPTPTPMTFADLSICNLRINQSFCGSAICGLAHLEEICGFAIAEWAQEFVDLRFENL